jgi:hypothetical protein
MHGRDENDAHELFGQPAGDCPGTASDVTPRSNGKLPLTVRRSAGLILFLGIVGRVEPRDGD